MAGVVKARIEGDSSGFRASVNSAMRSVNEFKSMASTVAPVVGGMLSVHGFVELGKDAIETGAHVYNLAQRLGVGTSTIQKFGYAAKLTGTDSEQLVKGLLKLQANISNGGIETEKYQAALSKLGLTTKDLVNVSPEEAMLRLADAFSKTTNRGEANAAIVALLGVRMSGLIPLLAEGRKGLEEMFKDAPQMADETVLAMKALDDELIRMKAEIMPGAAEATGLFADKLRSIVNIVQKGIAGMAMFKDIAAFVAQGKTLSDAFSLADELHSSTTNTQGNALFSNKIKPPKKGDFEAPDEKPKKPEKKAKEKDNSEKIASELARLDEITFQNKLKGMTAEEKTVALKEKELELTKKIAAAEDDVGTSDEDYLKMLIERERIRGELAGIHAPEERSGKGANPNTQIYAAPLQLVGAISRAVFAQSQASPIDRTSQQLIMTNSKLDRVVTNTEKTAAALTNQ